MLASGHAKAYHPDAAVIHSHDYPPIQLFQRSFDEWRALAEVRGMAAEGRPLGLALDVQRRVRDDLRYVRRDGAGGLGLIRTAAASLGHHAARASGAALGSRAARLPAPVRRACSLEGRAGANTGRMRRSSSAIATPSAPARAARRAYLTIEHHGWRDFLYRL